MTAFLALQAVSQRLVQLQEVRQPSVAQHSAAAAACDCLAAVIDCKPASPGVAAALRRPQGVGAVTTVNAFIRLCSSGTALDSP